MAGVISNFKGGKRLGSQIAEGNFGGVAKLGGKLGGRLLGSGAGAIRVHGLEKLARDLEQVPGDVRGEVNKTLKELAEKGARYAANSAATLGLPRSTVEGYKPASSRATSGRQWASVRQTRRKTTGLRPDYAELQRSRILDPLEAEIAPEVEAAIERALDHALRRNGF